MRFNNVFDKKSEESSLDNYKSGTNEKLLLIIAVPKVELSLKIQSIVKLIQPRFRYHFD